MHSSGAPVPRAFRHPSDTWRPRRALIVLCIINLGVVPGAKLQGSYLAVTVQRYLAGGPWPVPSPTPHPTKSHVLKPAAREIEPPTQLHLAILPAAILCQPPESLHQHSGGLQFRQTPVPSGRGVAIHSYVGQESGGLQVCSRVAT